jgi:hypothetical protein
MGRGNCVVLLVTSPSYRPYHGAVATSRHGSTALPNTVAALNATRMTPDVAGRARTLFGHVRALYRAAVYIELRPSGTLLVVAIDAVGGVPRGILVGGVVDLRQTGIERGMAFLPSAEGWSIPSAGMVIDASDAATWHPTLPAAARATATPDLGQAVGAARALAAARAPAGGLAPMLAGGDRQGDPWLSVARSLIRRQLDALRAGDVAAAIGPTAELIGLGTGLTPSGDDYLTGLLAGLDATGHPARHALATAIERGIPGRTTAVGAALLGHAVHGEFTERLHDVLAALAAGRPDSVAGPIERAMAYGATSGSDTLVGLFSGLEIAVARRARTAEAVA